MVRGAYDRDDLEARVSGLAGDVEGTRGLILALDGALSPIRSLPVPGSALSFLWPALARPGLRVIATATPDDYRRYAAEDPAAVRAFQVIPWRSCRPSRRRRSSPRRGPDTRPTTR
nr:hypothetical protein GCM10020093_106440 [Planobispora longispora]